MHILDLRQFKSVTVEDVAKRLMDYGFHAPTISWPVPGTNDDRADRKRIEGRADRFSEALIAIHAEIQMLESGVADKQNNCVEKRAAHGGYGGVGELESPLFPRAGVLPGQMAARIQVLAAGRSHRYVYGDRNLVCACGGYG